MKKQDEGYALVLVLVVMVVLSIAASGLMTLGLSNLKAQQAVGQRMADKYAAEGEIEKFVALLSQDAEMEKELEDLPNISEEEAQKELEKRLAGYVTEWVKAKTGAEPADLVVNKVGTKYTYTCTIDLKAEKDSAAIECKLKLTGDVAETETGLNKVLCRIDPAAPIYKSYVISHASEGGGSE